MGPTATDGLRHIVSLFDLSPEEIRDVLDDAKKLKSKLKAGDREPLLQGHVICLIFEKPSLRTRVSFETGIRQLGGSSLFLGEDSGWGKDRESISDFAQVLSSYVDAIVCRAKSHKIVEELAKYATCPVINGLTDLFHPCQALADILTVEELCEGNDPVAYIGDGNNVAKSLALICAALGRPFRIGAPEGYEMPQDFVERLKSDFPETEIIQTTSPVEAVDNACAVYTDVWASMGQEKERESRKKIFADYQVNESLFAKAQSNAIFLHCLPARRGEEVTDGVMDSPQSAIIHQAENRLHAQKGLMYWLMK